MDQDTKPLDAFVRFLVQNFLQKAVENHRVSDEAQKRINHWCTGVKIGDYDPSAGADSLPIDTEKNGLLLINTAVTLISALEPSETKQLQQISLASKGGQQL